MEKNQKMTNNPSCEEFEEIQKLNPPGPITPRIIQSIGACFFRAMVNFYDQHPDIKKKVDRRIRYYKNKSSKK